MFYDRREAGEQLAHKLQKYRSKDVVVYGLPRGGVIVADQVARYLGAPLSLIITRKLTHPGSPEYAIGAVAEHTEPIFNEAEAAAVNLQWLEYELERQRAELIRRKRRYLRGHKPASAHGKIAILVDDGVATGLTMQAAIEEARERDPVRVVVAVPVAPYDTAELLREQADELVVIETPRVFRGGVGAYYQNFEQTTDREVIDCLQRTATRVG